MQSSRNLSPVRRAPRHIALWLTALALLGLGLGQSPARGESIAVPGSTGTPGLTLRSQSAGEVVLHYEMGSYGVESVEVGGQSMQKIVLSGVFLPNNAGAPDLPGLGRFIAIPEGATATVEVENATILRRGDFRVAPAPEIPKDTDPIRAATPDPAIYGRDAFYPAQPALLSEPGEMRGVDVVNLGLTPFQYNPVSGELLVYAEADIRIRFHGGTGTFGEDRLRSRSWDSILAQHLVNFASLPAVDFDQRRAGRDGFEYIIITPDHPDFIAWGDTLKTWRKLQGITTETFTTTEVGGTTSAAIEAFLNNAYNTWEIAPDAFLLLGDFPSTGFRDSGITAPTWNSYCVSDNIYADVNADNLPDMIHARITARNAAELQTMIGKMLSYERAPYLDPGFYDHPVIAGGWQTERWFILCSEIVYGHQSIVLGKSPVREYAIYDGTPGSSWSSNQNTPLVVNYFGPNGLGYIPATPQHLTDWGGNATRINNDINTGAYMMIHRDHGLETGWGEPAYENGDLSGLHNEMLPFVFSMNCLTGKYNWSGQSFTEVFHRMSQGAVGLIAASEISYSFVNDTYIFGLMDTMWPEFMPDYGPYPPPSLSSALLRPAFGQASGKYFLQASNWPYNPEHKVYTHHLFHHHGDAFLTLNTEVPQAMAITHDPVCFLGTDSFRMQAETGAFIALTFEGEIIGTAQATGLPQDVQITPPTQPGTLRITITKPNRFRYDQSVPVVPPSGPYLVFQSCTVDDAGGDGVFDEGETGGISVLLRNVGVDPTTAVRATLTSEDAYVEILTPQRDFPDIPAGGSEHCDQPYEVRVSGQVPDGHVIAFHLAIEANEGSWEGAFTLPAQAPVMASGRIFVNDAAPLGNGNGVPDPGDGLTFQLLLRNDGHSATSPLILSLSSDNPFVVITDADGECMAVPAGDERIAGAFGIAISSGCPSPTTLALRLHATGEGGYAADLDFEIGVGAWVDEMEVDRGWTLGAEGDNAGSGLWVRAEPVGTTYNGEQCQPEYDHTSDPGSVCFVTGNGSVGGAAGEADVDGGKTTILTPVFALGDAVTATLEYWRWYTNSLGNNPNQDYWDVDVTADGVNWVSLEHTTNSANAWTQQTFDLGAYVPLTDHVQVRFVARDEGSGSLVEAAIDDVVLTVVRTPSTSVDDTGLPPVSLEVRPARTPSRVPAEIVYTLGNAAEPRVRLYDVSGRVVRSFLEGRRAPGRYTLTFDGRDDLGREVASGVYFVRLDAGGATRAHRLVLVR